MPSFSICVPAGDDDVILAAALPSHQRYESCTAAPSTVPRGLLRAAVVRGRGRPPTIALTPITTLDAASYNALVDEARQGHIEADVVVVGQRDEPELAARLRVVEGSLAKEAAGLLFERRQAEKAGRDGSQISGRRIDALLKLASLVLERQRLGLGGDNAEHLQLVTALFVDTVRRVAAETLPAEVGSRVLAAFQSEILK